MREHRRTRSASGMDGSRSARSAGANAGLARPTEKAFQATIIELATFLGWKSFHAFDSRRSAGGFPDLVLVRGGRLVFAELKKEGEQPRPDQVEWLTALERAGVEVYVWTIADWAEIAATLTNSSRPVPAQRTAT